MGALAVFALEGSGDYGLRAATHAGLVLSRHEERGFEDGEHKMRPLEPVRGRDCAVIHSLHAGPDQSANDKLCRLLFFCGALKDSGARRVTVIIPYLCYARKDRRTQPGDPITTRYVGNLFEAMGIDEVVTIEVHNIAAFENGFRMPTRHISGTPILAAHFADPAFAEDIVVVSPDAGGAKRAEQFRQQLEILRDRPVGNAIMEKYRARGIVSGSILAGDVKGKMAVVVDDLIASGTTLCRAAKACRSAGATRVFAAAAHGLFIGGAEEIFANADIEGIVTLDTVPPFRLGKPHPRKLTILNSTEIVAALLSELAPDQGC